MQYILFHIVERNVSDFKYFVSEIEKGFVLYRFLNLTVPSNGLNYLM